MAKQHPMTSSALAILQSANIAHDQAIIAHDLYEVLLASIPLDNEQLYAQVKLWRDKAYKAISATWHAKDAVEQALQAVRVLEKG